MTSSHSLLKSCVILQLLGIIGWIVVIIARLKIIFICLWGQVSILHHLYLRERGPELVPPWSLAGDFGASRCELGVGGLEGRARLRAGGGQGHGPGAEPPRPAPMAPLEGGRHPRRPEPCPASRRGEPRDRDRGGAGAAFLGLGRELRGRSAATRGSLGFFHSAFCGIHPC